ncbi:UDP-N-acetylmuramoyl-L-alanyl-D-glutamate--2,6-diaminopimelate ligase [Granulicella sibirica]|uniref:UDP-N-acetylmuramoyl-L-alanyl-D-glutamate--2,6-diaminopimelate ligase n=1 Tax=Granulicella sibirica TaxID=2479048 RepID=A0A4Q0T457_9BACT|nr:UDP-N-acetylmuramoyl-L-alanyl-D-glutamate--2,6-diaminopimelate ligase [Granulicella sibirica]RXH57320.1 UDP-N-acetylmuramoylalanyl-D-glutamate--2,6-diaminopimelate ligase [Granulicella sibirica]
MLWAEALKGVTVVERFDAPVQVAGVEYDSRRVQHGDIFVAMRGGSTDGNRFIDIAVSRGAAGIVTDSREAYDAHRSTRPISPVALVSHGRRALAEVAANVFSHPEERLAISAVTGTNGKTTTAYLLEQFLKSAGRTCVLIGTIETHVADEVRSSEHTTPEARDLFATFADGVAAGATETIMEMSSHALDQERVWSIPLDVALFTNLTQDHLDYHVTMDRYFEAKARMFEGVGAKAPRVAVINADDPHGDLLQQKAMANGSEVMSYGLGPRAAYRADNISLRAGATIFDFDTPAGCVPIMSPLTGRVNVYNLLAASCAALARGLSLGEIAGAAERLGQVPGRFQVVPSGNAKIAVVVDYAHTDDALRNLIALGRELVGPHGGRVITLFGCGGDRDRTKRPKMGRAAAEGSDLIVVTSDNPRSEDPEKIIEEIMVGIRETGTICIVEEDRAGAISIAIRAARAGDIVLIAGKGHEKVQIFADETVPFDDVAVATGVLAELNEVDGDPNEA